jgi:hypothetical protein
VDVHEFGEEREGVGDRAVVHGGNIEIIGIQRAFHNSQLSILYSSLANLYLWEFRKTSPNAKVPLSRDFYNLQEMSRTYFFFLAAFFLGAAFFLAAFFLVAILFEFNV